MSTVADHAIPVDTLNEQQRAAVEHTDGPLLILAGAGTGKTRTLVARVTRLLERGTDPERILLVTFSRRAAVEMIERTGAMVGHAVARRIHAGTFHAMANRLLRVHGDQLGLQPGFSVLDKSDTAELFGLIRNDGNFASDKRFARNETLGNIYSRVVNSQLPLDQVIKQWFPWCDGQQEDIGRMFTTYVQRKQATGVLDYDDLLLYWRAASMHESVGPALASLYDHVLVDEYQDTNALQADILRSLRATNHNITVVGDDAQSIYSFRCATVRNILDFPAQFAGATTVTLERNYRSTQPILDLANAVIRESSESFNKQLWSSEPGSLKPTVATCRDERAQVEAVCNTILQHLEDGMTLREQCVLFRTAHHSDALEVELMSRNIPFVKFGGLRFLEAAHVRDLMALLRVLDNPYDQLAWTRVLQLSPRVGAARAQRVLEHIGVHPRLESTDPLARFLADPAAALPKCATDLGEIAGALRDCGDETLPPGVQIARLRQLIEPLLRQRYDNAEARIADLVQLERLAIDYPSRSRLVSELTLDPPTSTSELAGPPKLDDDYITLSTVHSAKGGEWGAVHVIHAADGSFPSDMATRNTESIDEERRLFYVALTRARRHLHIYAPLAYHHSGRGIGDAHSYAQRTRFLPPSVDHLVDIRAVRTLAADSPTGSVPAADLTSSVDDTLRALWG